MSDPDQTLKEALLTNATDLARAFEHLHKLAHPDESPYLSFCKAEPCRSLPWAVVNEIAKVA